MGTKKNKSEVSEKDVESFWKSFTGDISAKTAARELLTGASAGWFTGFMSARIGKAAALGLGGAIILLKIAHEKGYININWNKVNKNLDKIADKIEGREPTWSEKAERFVDRKLDAAEGTLKNKQSKIKRWYSKVAGDSQCKLRDSHIFLVAFAAGVAIGIKTAY